jgi:hypothetical protein
MSVYGYLMNNVVIDGDHGMDMLAEPPVTEISIRR